MHSGNTCSRNSWSIYPCIPYRRCVRRCPAKYPTKTFSHLDQFLTMAFAQLTYRESLRDIETCLRAHQTKPYHLGDRRHVAKSTLADANEQRDWRIYADFALSLIQTARKLYTDDGFAVELDQTAYALDTTTIDLCLAVFPWAHFRSTKAAVKLHTLRDLRGNIPSFIHISDGKMHEVNVLDILAFEADSFYIMDRGFIDFARLFIRHQAQAFFVIRAKSNLACRRVYSRPVDKSTGLRCDQTIAQLYRCRWQVALFFKWIKQHLRIKAFYGTTENAVKTQIWIAITVYVLVAIVKKRLNTQASLYTILQILSPTLFGKTLIDQLLKETEQNLAMLKKLNQLNLFG